MAKGGFFDLFRTLTGLKPAGSDPPWTSDILGVDRAEWDAVLTERSWWRLASSHRDVREIIAILAWGAETRR
jgi:hypothetical protein